MCVSVPSKLGQALWYQSKWHKAVRTMEGVRELFDSVGNISSDPDLLEMQVLVGVECYYSFTTLAHLAPEAVERLQVVSRGHERFANVCRKGDELAGIAKKAYSRASAMSITLQNLCEPNSSHLAFEDIQHDHRLSSVQDIQAAAEDLQSWWERRKAARVVYKDSRSSISSFGKSSLELCNETCRSRFQLVDGDTVARSGY